MSNNYKAFSDNLKKVMTITKSFYKAIIISTIAFVLLFSAYFYCQNFLEPKAYDFLIRLTANEKASKDIVNVYIDDQSITQIDRWPWKRSYYADIFEYLENYGKAKIIAFDSIIISYGEKKDDLEFFNRINKLDNIVLGTFFSKQKDFFYIQDKNKLDKIFNKKFAINVSDKRSKKIIKNTEYLSSSYILKELLNLRGSVGSVLYHADNDGIIRKIEPVFYYNGHYYPSLPLAVYSRLFKTKKFSINNNFIKSDTQNFKIPIDSTSNGSFAYIKWYKSFEKNTVYSYKNYSAWKIIKSFEQIKNNEKPLLPPELFKNKIIVVGATATALKDIKSTSIGENYPGVDIQATCIDNVLNNNYMQKPDILVKITILLFLLLVSSGMIILLQPLYSTILVTMIMLGYFEACLFSFTKGYAPDVVTPQFFIICSLIFGYGYKYFLEGNKKNRIQKIMAKYVSKDIMLDILKNSDDVKPGGKRAEVTVLFADIRGFTAIAETLEPEEVSAILNVYFSEMVPIILKNKGILNKFMGDAFLAIFGAPIENSNHPKLAVKCAVELLSKVKELQEEWIQEGKPKIEIGIGINTGIAFVGNIGSEDRLEYTVIGDTVNLANRLESFNKLYSTRLLISSSTYEKVKDSVDTIKINSVKIKGRSEIVDIFEVIDFTE